MEQLGEITVEGGATPAPAPAPALIRPTPGEVAITRPNGAVQTVAESDLSDALAQGDRPATSAEYTNAKMGRAGPAASFVSEGARTFTAGLSDVALVEGDRLIEGDAEAERMRQALREMREVNPGANLAGTVAGSLAALALGAPPSGGAIEGAGDGRPAIREAEFCASALAGDLVEAQEPAVRIERFCPGRNQCR